MQKSLTRFARWSVAAIAFVLVHAPAAAQAMPAAYFSANKTAAILGSQSKLAAIMAQQSGQPLPQTIAPAGYGSSVLRADLPIYRPAISSDRPDVFGSVALPIQRTSLERRWRQVASGRVGAAPGTFAAALQSHSPIERLEAVNRYVNARVTFIDDIRQYGADDRWVPAAETLRRGRGDCEDYAIAKLQMLRRAGFADRDLYLVIVRDVLRRADHAVLVARAEGRLLVLDTGTDRLADTYDLPNYRPIVTFSGNSAWAHGYRRDPAPPMVIAANQVPTPTETMIAARIAAVAPSALAN